MKYDNTNSGAIFRNKKRENDKQPTHTGTLNVEGKDYWVSAWIKTSGPASQNPGEKFFSIAITAKDGSASTGDNFDNDIDDDVPF